MENLTKEPNAGDHRIGDLRAPLNIVEYGDYECPHSAKASKWMTMLINEFRDDICYIYRHFPLSEIHPNSAIAAVSAEAAAGKNKFWEMHQLLFENYGNLSFETIIHLGEKLGLDEDDFLHGLDNLALTNKVCEDLVSGEESKVQSPPVFFFNGIRLEGPISMEILRSNIMKMLGGHRISA